MSHDNRWIHNWRGRKTAKVDTYTIRTSFCPLLLHSILPHFSDVIMDKIASQITSLTVVYLTVYSDAHQRKHQSSASLAFEWGIHRDRWIPRTKGQLRGKCFHLMTSSWISLNTYRLVMLELSVTIPGSASEPNQMSYTPSLLIRDITGIHLWFV